MGTPNLHGSHPFVTAGGQASVRCVPDLVFGEPHQVVESSHQSARLYTHVKINVFVGRIFLVKDSLGKTRCLYKCLRAALFFVHTKWSNPLLHPDSDVDVGEVVVKNRRDRRWPTRSTSKPLPHNSLSWISQDWPP